MHEVINVENFSKRFLYVEGPEQQCTGPSKTFLDRSDHMTFLIIN